MKRTPSHPGRSAFTLVELLVVIGIIALLMSILLPTLARVKEQANGIKCMANARELTKAWLMYADNHKGVVARSMTGPNEWVDNGDTEAAVTGGTLFPYAQSPGVYHCPADNLQRYRSFSLNDYWGGAWSAYQHVQKLSQVRKTTEVFVFIEEWDRRGFNQGSFVIDAYPSYRWVDYPAVFHGTGTTFTFADGHAEIYNWDEKRTREIQTNYAVHDGSTDIRKVQRVIGFGYPNQ
ncbi:MAG TPA: type II secretion system protein [Humisphaera sp.]